MNTTHIDASDDEKSSDTVNHRRRWLLAGAAVVVAAGVLLTVSAANGFGFAPANAADAGPKVASAAIKKQTLTATTEKDGTLTYTSDQTVSAAGGTITALPAEGAALARGTVILRVDQNPTVLLYGGLPMYRTLQSGDKGADVRQFEENLAALGYTGFTVDDTFTWNTAVAVKKWQADLGIAKTGVVSQSSVFYTAGAVNVASVTAKLGDQASGPVLNVASVNRTASVELKSSEAHYAVIGQPVSITVPGGSPVPGKITGVSTQITASGSGAPGDPVQKTTSITVVSTPDDPAAITTTGASTAKVNFTASKAENVLTVPVNALLALSEGGYAVELAGKSGKGKLVAVKTGLFAQGQVEVSGDGLAEGQKVVVPSS